MLYYKRHLGDYVRDTAHLSLIEVGAYDRLLDRYYITEQPIPADQAHRVAMARTKDERTAVDVVLAEFFTLIDGAYHNRRADEELPTMQAANAKNRENGKRGGRPPKVNENPTETEQKPSGFSVGSDPVSQDEPDGKGNHYPLAINHKERQNPSARPAPVEAVEPPAETDARALSGTAGELSKAFRDHGVMTSPHEPRLLALLAAGLTPAMAEAACEVAREVKPSPERIPPAYVYAICERWQAEPATVPAAVANRSRSPADVAAAALRLLEARDLAEQGA